ncbi:hypothetical protein V2A60_005728 [Cordyceps javanica]
MSRKTLLEKLLEWKRLRQVIDYMASSRDSWSLIRSSKPIYNAFKQKIYEIDAEALQPRALLWAASRGDMTVLKAALDAGTDIDTQFSHSFSFGDDARHGLTSIMAAAAAGHEEIVRHLLDNGASPRGMDQTGLNALHYAARGGHKNLVELLLKHSPTLIYDHGQHGIRFGLPAPYAADRESILKQLLEAMNEEMRGSSLEAAVSHGYDAFFDILVEAGVLMDSSSLLETAFLGNTEVKASGDDLDKLLIVACEQGHYDAVEMLIKCGANPNGGLNGVGPLCCAVTSYHLDIVKLLVARGAKIDNMIHFDSFWIEDEVKESLARHGGIRKFLLASGADLESVKIRE